MKPHWVKVKNAASPAMLRAKDCSGRLLMPFKLDPNNDPNEAYEVRPADVLHDCKREAAN